MADGKCSACGSAIARKAWIEREMPYRHWRLQSKTGAYWIVANVKGEVRAALSFENDWRGVHFACWDSAKAWCERMENLDPSGMEADPKSPASPEEACRAKSGPH